MQTAAQADGTTRQKHTRGPAIQNPLREGAMHLRNLALGVAALTSAALMTNTVSAADNIRIALIEPFSGPVAGIGRDTLEGFEFYIDRINAAGGVLGGRKLEVVPLDNVMNAEKTTQQLRKAIDMGIRYVSQGVGSNHALNIIKSLKKYNKRNPGKEVMYFNYSAVTTAFTNSLCMFWHFRFDHNVDQKVAALTSFMGNDKDVKKVYMINQNYAYGQSFQKAARKYLKERTPNATLVGDELIVPFGKILDFTPYISKIKGSGADTVLTGNWGADASRLIAAGADAGLKVKYYSIYAGVPNAMKTMGTKVSTFAPILQVTESHENDPSEPAWLIEIENDYLAK
ncbi:MAG: ABC transporter substrate-binding protein, partial [Alphaproteobacteria bacterium]|nr:ABC transporter substrate-binding protein [Alphaproteobacteria bacterium]